MTTHGSSRRPSVDRPRSVSPAQPGIEPVQRVWGYLDEYHEERNDILAAVDHVFSSGQLVLGPSVERFEREFAGYHEMRHCIGVDNGTNAIVVALRALGVGRGDEVITVSNTAAPTVVAIDAVGATPVFVDIDEDTYLMDVSMLEAAITARTRCVVVVHLYGQCVSMEAVAQVCDRRGIPVLEDCAQSHAATRQGRLAGTWGAASAFSFYPTKVMGAYGDAGAIITDDDEIARSLRRLRCYGMEDDYHVVATPGYNSRLDEVQAEILARKLTRLDQYVARRRVLANRYAEAMADTDLVLPSTAPGNQHVYYLYVVRHPRRDEILAALERIGIKLTVSYRHPVHRQDGFAHLGYSAGSLPVTERAAEEIFSLPMYPSLSDAAQDRVIEEMTKLLRTMA